MKTLILPGFSTKNKDWANEMKKILELKFFVEVIEWEHWSTGNTDFDNWNEWIEQETPKVLNRVQGEKVNILAKSIGTLMAMNILKIKPNVVNKLFICGIPLHDIQKTDRLKYKSLRNFPKDKVICIQNINDSHGTYEEVKTFLNEIDSEVKIISKPRGDHDYPYPKVFINFLVD